MNHNNKIDLFLKYIAQYFNLKYNFIKNIFYLINI